MVAWLIGSFLVVVWGQVGLTQNTEPTELERERLIRIIEPAIYPLLRLAEQERHREGDYDWSELSKSCAIGITTQKTELGQAYIHCHPDRPQSIAIHGGNTPEWIWANMTITVTVKGFNTHERLCWVPSDRNGIGDIMQYCDEKKPGTIRPVVVATFTLKTTLVRYDEKEAQEITAANLRRGQIVTSGGIFEPERIEAEDVKSRNVTMSPVRYEFPNRK